MNFDSTSSVLYSQIQQHSNTPITPSLLTDEYNSRPYHSNLDDKQTKPSIFPVLYSYIFNYTKNQLHKRLLKKYHNSTSSFDNSTSLNSKPVTIPYNYLIDNSLEITSTAFLKIYTKFDPSKNNTLIFHTNQTVQSLISDFLYNTNKTNSISNKLKNDQLSDLDPIDPCPVGARVGQQDAASRRPLQPHRALKPRYLRVSQPIVRTSATPWE